MTDLLTASPKLDAVFAINDPTGIGCDLAAKQAQRKDFFIVGVDGSPDGATTLKSKGSLFEATPAQDPYTMAKKAVEVGYGVMNGKKPEQETILVPVKLITRENVNECIKAGRSSQAHRLGHPDPGAFVWELFNGKVCGADGGICMTALHVSLVTCRRRRSLL